MRIILAYLALVTIISSNAVEYDEEDAYAEEVVNAMSDDDPRKLGLANTIRLNREFRGRRWAYQRNCRAQVPPPRNDTIYHCMTPHEGESCFGMPIDYTYLPSREMLPAQYEVLRRFPKCWDKLGPMLCGIIYRPCGVHQIVAKFTTEQKDIMEFWQRFPIGMCRRVHSDCEDAIKEGLFPSDLVNCNRSVKNAAWMKEKKNVNGALARFLPTPGDTEELKTEWERQTMFTEDLCTLSYSENASRHEKMQCIFPLVYTNATSHIRPVIDNCYLPCRNPLISSPDKFLSFRIIRALLCFVVAAACLSIFCFLVARSLIFVESDVIFAIACCLLSLGVYLFCWGTGSIGFLAEASECTYTIDGVAIRNTLLELPWCWLTAFVSHVSLLASIGFLAAAYALSAAAATKAAAREERKERARKSGDDSFSPPGIRFYLVAGVFVVSISIGLIAAGLNLVSIDGVAGVCSVGLHSIVDHLAFVAGPGLLYCLIGFSWGTRDIWREKKHREADIVQEMEEKIHEAIEHEKSKEKVDYLNERGPNWKEEVLEQIRRGSQPPSLEDKTETRGSVEEAAVEERKEEGEQREGEDEITTLTTVLIPGEDEDEQKQWLSDDQKNEIREKVRKEKQKEWRDREQRAWHEGISSRYTLLALCVCMLSLIFGLVVHYEKLANDGKEEYKAVRKYVTDVMLNSIARKSTHWLSETPHAAEKWADGAAESDPLVRRRNLASAIAIHETEYPSTGDDRMFGLMFVFVVFPILPVLVFIWAFFEGLAGAGGMKKVREQRVKQKKKRVQFDDVEMSHLTRDCDDDSQMMSSECSSMGDDHPYCDHNAASSTVSTRLSAASVAFSTHTSVSLRGALPRFPSTERLMTVHATPQVPSEAQTMPDHRRRSRSAAPHHRTLDMMGRMRERRAKMGKKKRASSAERNARREGVAESGQFAPRDDTRSVHSHNTVRTMLSGASASSYLVPPSEIQRVMIGNALTALRRTARAADERGAGMQERLQLLQEELVLRSLPRDEASDGNAATQQQDHMDWVGRLSAMRASLGEYQQDDVYAHVSYRGFLLAGQAIALARLAYANGTASYHANVQVLLFALERVDRLAHFIEARVAPSPELAADIEEGVTATSRQMELNGLPNVRLILNQQNVLFDLDVNHPERVQQRARIIAEVPPTVERQAAEYAEMLAATNQRYVLQLADRARLQQHLRQLVTNQQQPVYPPQRTIDLRLPPDGVEARSEAGSAFSMTNSTVPSSALTTHDHNRVDRMYQEVHRLPPPDYSDPSSSRSSSNNNNPAAAAGDRNGDAAHLLDFISAVMRANPAMAYARQTDHFNVPTSSSNDLNATLDDHDDDDEDEDVLSSETSMDTMGRRTAPSVRRYETAGGFVVPVVEVQQLSRAASASEMQQQRPTNGPRLPPFLSANGPQLPAVSASTSASASEAAEPHLELPEAPTEELGPRPKNQKKRKAMAVADDMAPSCQSFRRRRLQDDDDSAPPPSVNRVFVQEQPGISNGLLEMPLDGLTAATREGGRRRAAAAAADDDDDEEGGSVADSGIDSLASLNLPFRLLIGEGGVERPATNQEWAEFRMRTEGERNMRPRANSGRPGGEETARDERRRDEEEEAGPSNDDEERRRLRMMRRNHYLNHSDPDLAMAEEEERQRIRREMDGDDDEKWEREQLAIANARREQRGRERGAPVVDQQAELHGSRESISSLLTAEQQVELVNQLRDALENRSTDGMEPEHRRLVEHLRLALDTQGGISREEIVRYRVMEVNREARERRAPDRNSPYSVSSVVISRLSLAEIGARVDAIRALSGTTLYPLEIYYQLHLADVLWPLAGRDVMFGDNVYTHDEINRVLGADSPVVPSGWDSDDFHQLMRKRAITAASLTGRSYGRSRGTEGPQYQPPQLPDMGLYRTFQDPAVLRSAIDGDFEPLRRAIESLPLTMPDVMRLDNRSEHTLGTHLRHFRDYLDERARVAGYALRADTYATDAVPQEPTGGRPTLPLVVHNDEEGDIVEPNASGKPPAPDPEPDF